MQYCVFADGVIRYVIRYDRKHRSRTSREELNNLHVFSPLREVSFARIIFYQIYLSAIVVGQGFQHRPYFRRRLPPQSGQPKRRRPQLYLAETYSVFTCGVFLLQSILYLNQAEFNRRTKQSDIEDECSFVFTPDLLLSLYFT